MKDTLILAIESSCDETAASVVKNGRTILSNVISSQIELHKLYGGVVPEIASRKHIEKINQVIEEALKDADVLSEDASTVAYSYIGSELTYPIYFEGTIGAAKKHLHQTADEITKEVGVKALISVNKGLVTQASAAIPIVPLYMSVLYKVMKENNVHEGCICLLYTSPSPRD